MDSLVTLLSTTTILFFFSLTSAAERRAQLRQKTGAVDVMVKYNLPFFSFFLHTLLLYYSPYSVWLVSFFRFLFFL